MTFYRICLFFATTSLLHIILLEFTEAQVSEEQCSNTFRQGKDDFVLDTDESVKEGATFIASPQVTRAKECVAACCNNPECNLALMESGDEDGLIKSCFIFNCLYKKLKVCQFARKKGFKNYVLNSVFGNPLEEQTPKEEDLPPVAKAGPDTVVQPHDDVILNGIESKDDHKIETYHWQMVSGNPSAVIQKTPLKDQVIVSNLSAGVYKFSLTVTDNIGQSDSTVVTVLVLTPEQSHDHCLVPKKVGPCRASYPRWHYNALSEKCEKFIFGGCRENRNNYLTMEECTKACDKASAFKPATGGRHGPIATEKCGMTCGPEEFTCTNGCCIDKELECDQIKQCSDGSDEDQCDKLDSNFRSLLNIHVDKDKAHCTQSPVTGPCRASFTKWYYNPFDQKCHRFNYGGCNGNENNFENEQLCMAVCKGVSETDVFVSRANFERQEDSRNSASIGIAVALGLAILVMLAVIGYCLLKERQRQHQPRHPRIAANGAHLLPVEDTEKLVYNSTTKPI
ncbi:kunitz-type protease inhibitor 1a isoform X2 [Brachyhypopomus gauderio]|uniref:kunitz-type protease inhibitor 1a isoform X2 n=1 Tax=Brachyhypopomus gauderio TaxID=698409 RepID=UPI004041CCEA